jgi:hypothetical protein
MRFTYKTCIDQGPNFYQKENKVLKFLVLLTKVETNFIKKGYKALRVIARNILSNIRK